MLGTEVSVFRVVEAYRLQGNVGLPLRVDIDRHQKILAVDLQAVAGVKHQRDGVGTFRRHLRCEIADLGAHLGLRQIGRGRHLETGIAQQLRHGLGVIDRIRQLWDRTIGRLTDHQREAVLRECGLGAEQDRSGDHPIEERVTKHQTTSGNTGTRLVARFVRRFKRASM